MMALVLALMMDYRLLCPDYALCPSPPTATAVIEDRQPDGTDTAVAVHDNERCRDGRCPIPLKRWRLLRRR